MFGNNIKVHFAGCENIDHSLACLYAGVRYSLFSVYRFIYKLFEGKGGGRARNASKESIAAFSRHIRDYRHVIMDSGLFTLMFGAKAGKRDEKFICAWMEALCRFVHENDIRATCVEVDCQKILGVEEAWRMRERMRAMLPDRRMINVFHMEDGKKGLDRLIEYSDYMAISVPELRIHYGGGDEHRRAVVRLAHYIKNSKPSADIHLLGCTDVKLLRECRFCTSADSTSWLSMVTWGHIPLLGRHRMMSDIKEAEVNRLHDELTPYFAKYGIKMGKRGYKAVNVIVARCCLRDYARAAGDQT